MRMRSKPAARLRAAHTGRQPRALALARAQASRGAQLTSVLGHTVEVADPFSRFLLRLLDGSRDRAAIAAALIEAVECEQVALPQPLCEPEDWRAAVRDGLEENLASLARLGLLEE